MSSESKAFVTWGAGVATLGSKIVLFDLFVTYVVPVILLWMTGGKSYTFFDHSFPGLPFLYMFAGTCLFFLTFSLLFSPVAGVFIRARFRLLTYRMFSWVRWLFAAIFVVAALNFFIRGLGDYRYDEARLSEQLSVSLLFVLAGKSVAAFQAFFQMLSPVGSSRASPLYWILIVVALGLSADGTMGFVLFGAVAFVTLFPGFSAIVLTPASSWWKRVASFKPLIGALLILAGVAAMWVAGESLKRGSFESARDTFTALDQLYRMALWLIDRISTLFFSANLAAEAAVADPGFFQKGWAVINNSFYYRACAIFESLCTVSPARGEFAQISHMNYFLITSGSPLSDAGASPGIIASALYVFPFWMAPLFSGFYYFIVARAVDFGLAGRERRLSIIGYLFALLFLRAVLLNPADLLIVFTPILAFILIFAFVSFASHERNQQGFDAR